MMTLLLAAAAWFAAQDELGPEVVSKEHEFSIRPPLGWKGVPGTGASVARFTSPETPPEAMLNVIHYSCKNATSLAQFRGQLEQFLRETYQDHSVLFHRQGTLGGLPSFQIAIQHRDKENKEWVVYRAVLHRSNLDYYLFDGQCPAAGSDRRLALFEKSVGSFRLRPHEPSVEEKAAAARAVEALRTGAMNAKSLEGETWQAVFLEKLKVGYLRQKLSAATVEGVAGWSFESDTVLEYKYQEGKTWKSGGKDRTVVRGSFSADGRYQKIDSEEVVVTEKGEELKYRYSAVLRGDRLTVRRHLRGTDEESAFAVPEGTLITDVADVFRRAVALRSRQTYYVPVLNPFEGRVAWEWIEVAGKEIMSVRSNESKEVLVVLSTLERRRLLHYWYEPTGALYVLKGPKQVFVVFGMSKEEAMKP